MLLIRCAACKRKLWRYEKFGPGEVLRCHRKRIRKDFGNIIDGESKITCRCGQEIGIDKGTYYKMIPRSFSHSGTKRNG